MQTQDYIELEDEYGAHNYHPLDVVIERARGRLGLGRRRQAVPGLPGRLLRGEPGPLPPAILKALRGPGAQASR